MFLRLLLALLCLAAPAAAQNQDPRPSPAASAYQSPYRVKFTWTDEQLIPDLLRGPRANWKDYGRAPFSEWYDRSNQSRWIHRGPGMKHLPAPGIAAGKDARWLRERVLATGLRYVGLGYEHHHLPYWDPPADWPSSPGRPRSGRGLDCSNFTGFTYNLALGYQFTTDIQRQSELTELRGPGPDRSTRVTRIELPKDFDDYDRVLRPADLLFIKNNSGRLSHVVLWVGPLGRHKGKTQWLILDSTDGTHRDAEGQPIPPGIQLRPFTPRSWYFNNVSHALRIIHD
jgi:cell wall-associated NlpC family hydrolase